MRLLISGYYGFGNVGDEAVLATIVEGLNERVSGADIRVLSAAPAETARLHGVGAICRTDLPAVWRALKTSDLFLSGGGSLLQDVTSRRSLAYYTALFTLARRAGTPFAIFAQGIGPIGRERAARRVAAQFAGARAVTVRDEPSAARLAEWGLSSRAVHVTADPAFLLTPRRSRRVQSGLQSLTWDTALRGPLIGVSLRPLPGTGEPTGAAAFTRLWARALDRLVDELGARLVFLPMQPGVDEAVARRVIAHMEHGRRTNAWRMEMESESSGPGASAWHPAEYMAVWGALDVAVAMRYHAALFAAASGVPVVGVPYDPKVEALLAQLGGEETTGRWGWNAAPSELLSSVKRVAKTAAPGASRASAALRRRVAELRTEASRTFDLVLETREAPAALSTASRRQTAAGGRRSGSGAEERGGRRAEERGGRRAEVLGFPIDLVDRERALRRIAAVWDVSEAEGARPKDASSGSDASPLEEGGGADTSKRTAPYWVVTANPELVRHAHADREVLRAVRRHAGLVVCDGIGLVWGARRLGIPVPERVPGVELAEAAVELAAQLNVRLYVVGGAPGVAEEAARKWRRRYPGLRVAGAVHGYFTPDEGDALADRIRSAAPGLLLVGLGAPRQERWIADHLERWAGMGGVVIGVGGTLDVVAGRARRAPGWVQRIGLEWLYRLVRQPSRLRRMGALPWFVWRVLGAAGGWNRGNVPLY